MNMELEIRNNQSGESVSLSGVERNPIAENSVQGYVRLLNEICPDYVFDEAIAEPHFKGEDIPPQLNDVLSFTHKVDTMLQRGLGNYRKRRREVVRRYYGLDGNGHRTHSRVSSELGISVSQSERARKSAIQHLKLAATRKSSRRLGIEISLEDLIESDLLSGTPSVRVKGPASPEDIAEMFRQVREEVEAREAEKGI